MLFANATWRPRQRVINASVFNTVEHVCPARMLARPTPNMDVQETAIDIMARVVVGQIRFTRLKVGIIISIYHMLYTHSNMHTHIHTKQVTNN